MWPGVAWGRAGGAEPRLRRILPNCRSTSDAHALRTDRKGDAGLFVCFCLLSPAGCWARSGYLGRGEHPGRAVSPMRAARWHSRPAHCPATAPSPGHPCFKAHFDAHKRLGLFLGFQARHTLRPGRASSPFSAAFLKSTLHSTGWGKEGVLCYSKKVQSCAFYGSRRTGVLPPQQARGRPPWE